MPPELLFDPSQLDFGRVVADLEEIRKFNPQREEMEQLTAVVHVDLQQEVTVGYKDVRLDEFWVKGHMPGYPLMPGVLMCEAAAQLCSFYLRAYTQVPCDFIGFGGLDNVRFRGVVKPGDRLVLVGKMLKVRRRLILCSTQGLVGGTMVFQADIQGVPMMRGQATPSDQEG